MCIVRAICHSTCKLVIVRTKFMQLTCCPHFYFASISLREHASQTNTTENQIFWVIKGSVNLPRYILERILATETQQHLMSRALPNLICRRFQEYCGPIASLSLQKKKKKKRKLHSYSRYYCFEIGALSRRPYQTGTRGLNQYGRLLRNYEVFKQLVTSQIL